MKTKTYKIGKITLGDRVHVSDPCYAQDCWCAATLENVLPGTYHCEIVSVPDDCFATATEGIYSRVKRLSIFHEDHKLCPQEYIPADIGVDSGQAGFYDAAYYALHHPKDEVVHLGSQRSERVDAQWYERVCDITRKTEPNPKYIEKERYLKSKLGKHYLAKKDIKAAYCKLRKNEISQGQLDNALKLRFDAQTAYGMEACSRPTEEIGYAGILDDRCVVASAGYGDGSYGCFVARNKEGQIVAARIQFL